MRIAIYVQDLRASGVVRAMIAMAQALAGGVDDIVIVAGYQTGSLADTAVAPARLIAAAGASRGRLPRLAVVPRLRRTLRDLRPDVILSGGNFGHFSLWAATRGLGLPIVYVFSNELERAGQPWRNRWRRLWSGLLVAGAARSVLVGSGLARSGVFRRAVTDGRAVLIRNGLDPARVPPPSAMVPGPMRGPVPVILAIGRLQPQKNFEGLIDAFALAAATRPLRLVILGTGTDAYREALAAHAAARGVEEAVLFAGVTDDVFPWLRAARVFALASRWEGSSIALLEAMAARTPIVAARTAGDAAEVLGEGRFGLLADPDDAPALAAALLRQIDDPVTPGDRIEAFTAAAMVRAYHNLLIAAARERAPAAPPPGRDAPAAAPPSR